MDERAIDGVVGLFKPRRKPEACENESEIQRQTFATTDWEYNHRKRAEQEEIDAILDKLKQSGYSGLSSEEKSYSMPAGNRTRFRA